MRKLRQKFNLILILVMMLTMAQSAWADDVVNYEVITEVPIVDDGQKTNWNSSEDYGSLVDGKTGTKYGISNAEPWVEFHYSRAFVPKRYIIWTADDSNGGRNPITYTIKAKLNKTDDWTTIVDNASGSELPKANNTKKEFGIENNTKAYKYYRFEATKGNSGFQLAELQFMEVANKITVTWKMEGGLSQDAGLTETDNTFCSIDNDNKTADLTTDSHAITMRYSWKSGDGLKWRNTISPKYASQGRATFDHPKTNGCVVTFPNLKGTVTSLKMTRLIFRHQQEFSYKIKMYVGTKKGDNITLLTINDNDFLESKGDGVPFTATFNGGVEVDENDPLTIWFDGEELEDGGAYNFSFHGSTSSSLREKSTLSITYVPEEELDAGHVFTSANISASGNVLTAICSSTDAAHNTLYGGANHRYTLKLDAEDDVYNIKVAHSATFTPSLTDFNADTQLNATCSFNYHNNDTGEDGTTPPRNVGNYTVTATVKINGENYPLTKSFNIWDAYRVNSNYTQFSFSPSMVKQGALMTITFTPQLGETVKTLALTGENTGDNINLTDNHDGTYTFTMPAENVNLSASFDFPTNANFEQNGNTYTVKNADGWNYFCQRMENDATLDGFNGKTVELADDITVTTMAGSINQKFKGTFDGKGHTLTFNCTATGPNTAPFYITDGATIRNLHATGLIEGGIYNYMGGLVGEAMGSLTIENCWVSTQISTTYSYNYNVGHGGIVGYLNSGYDQCHITGCVFDGLIYNPNYSGTTYGCGGFIGAMSQYGYAILKDCLFLHGQYDNNNGKCELKWGTNNDQNSTFFHRSNGYGEGTLTNCFYVGTRGLKQGSPAEVSDNKPANFDNFGEPTDHCFLKIYGHTMVFDNKYYTPIYGDLVEKYGYSGWKSYNIEYDDAPLGIPDITSPLWTECLRYNRSFTAGKPVTIMLPFNFTRDRITLAHDNANPSGKFYEFKGIDNSGNPIMDEGNEVIENTLQANHPYLYVPGESTEYWDTYVSSGINIFTQDNGGGSKVAAYEGFELRGTYTEKVWEENDPEIGKAYVYNANGELVPVAAGTRIRPTECYIIQTKKLMTGTDITVTIPSVEWTGSEIAFDETAVVVKDGETTLTLTTDYTVTAPTGTLQDTGDYPVTITGAGEYAGEVVAMFTIKGKPVTVKNDLNEDVPAATGDAEITQDQDGLTLTLTTPTESTTPHTVNVPQPVEVDHVSIDRTFEAGKACTLYLPFSIAADKIAGGTFNTFTGVDTSNPSEWIVQYSPVAGDIEANTPYIFLPNGGKITVNNGENKVTICTANPHTTEKDQWDFIGTYERIKWTHNTSDPEYDSYREAEIGSIYGFAAEEKSDATVGQFVQVTDNVWINPMRAYLKHTVVAPARSMDGDAATTELPSSMKVVIVEGTTGITSMEDVRGKMSDAWYSLDGRKLQGKPTTKGMYIHNGRKEVVK